MERTDTRKTMKFIVLSAVLAGLIAIGAWLRIELPLVPAPITMQTLFVLLAGVLLPPLWAAAAVGLYLFAGLIGLPVFAGGARGFAVVMGPTGGFLIGFLLAAVVVSLICGAFGKYFGRYKDVNADDGRSFRAFFKRHAHQIGTPVALIAGTLTIYAVGYPWLVVVLEWDWIVGLAKGVLPFLPGDILKILVIALLTEPAKKIILRDA